MSVVHVFESGPIFIGPAISSAEFGADLFIPTPLPLKKMESATLELFCLS